MTKGLVKTSYNPNDVTLLLKDLTGKIEPLPTQVREEKIQHGVHYSEMLPLEYKPQEAYFALYQKALELHGEKTAKAVGAVAEKIYAKKGKDVVLVSLVRAGLPIGILIKTYLEKKYSISVAHYGISIIRGRGIDHNAMAYILARHSAESVQFVDGWIGKGAIIKELQQAVKAYTGLDWELAVLADPAGLTPLFGTRADFLIPSSCLNSTVSGLISRSILNQALIGPEDFHGVVYYQELEQEDVSLDFLAEIIAKLPTTYEPEADTAVASSGMEQVLAIAQDFGIKDINLIKPGIGETTRVLLRRVPWKILLKDINDKENIGHILQLCQDRNVPVEEYPLESYAACGIIKNLLADV